MNLFDESDNRTTRQKVVDSRKPPEWEMVIAKPRKLKMKWSQEAVDDLQRLWGNDIETEIIANAMKSMKEDLFIARTTKVYDVNDENTRDWLRRAIPAASKDTTIYLNGVLLAHIQEDADLVEIGDSVETHGVELPDIISILASLDDGTLQCEGEEG